MRYTEIMKRIANTEGLSRIEAVCITGISLVALALVAALGWYLLNLMWQGNDAGSLNNAEHIASVNVTGTCLVPGCSGDAAVEHKEHLQSDGSVRAYFSKGANALTGNKPYGYNEGTTLEVDGTKQSVERGTMVIEVTEKDGQISSTWVEGA